VPVYATAMLATAVAAVRTFVLVPLFFVWTLVLATFIIVYGSFRPASPIHDAIVRHWARLFLAIPPVKLDVEGIENVDPAKRYVVASNHLSMVDIPLLIRVLPLAGRYLSKKEVFRIPVVGTAMRIIGMISIDREAGGGSTRQAVNDGVQLAAERGYSLLVFPEGTRATEGTMLPFKKGAFRIAIDTGLPLLPVVLEGTERVLAPGSKVFRRGDVSVRILPPIDTSNMTNKDDLSQLMADVEADIATTWESLRT